MISHAKRKAIQSLYAKGMNKSQIARIVDVCRQTVNSYVDKKKTSRTSNRYRILKAITMNGGKSFMADDVAVVANASRVSVQAELRLLCRRGLLESTGGKGKTYRVPDQPAFYRFYLDYKDSKKI
jgi:predicted transcriptional regulator